MKTTPNHCCPVCSSCHLKIFFHMPNVPVYCNLLWPSKQEAQDCQRGDIKLALCSVCGFITNVAFDTNLLDYSAAYENSLHFSPRFQEYARELAGELVQRYDLYHKDILEIGCGKGDFLISLCELGDNRGIGFDPGHTGQATDRHGKASVRFVQDYYSERYADHFSGDLICCRHALEHIESPGALLRTVRRSISERTDTTVFFEVPNALHTFHRLWIWDIIYEHCSYFTSHSLAYLFLANGFHVCEITEAYEGQFLCLHARLSDLLDSAGMVPNGTDLHGGRSSLASDIDTFASGFERMVKHWAHKLRQLQQQGKRVVVWGMGAKGVTFLNLLVTQDQIEYVVDINPRKQGMYVPGTGQRIIAPENLQDFPPDVVIVMNPIYQEEIAQLIEGLGMDVSLIPAYES